MCEAGDPLEGYRKESTVKMWAWDKGYRWGSKVGRGELETGSFAIKKKFNLNIATEVHNKTPGSSCGKEHRVGQTW